MASTNQIFIPRSVAADNVDALVKTGVAQVALRNGDIVVLGAKTDGVYALTPFATGATAIGIVYNADVENIEGYRVGGDDPRKIVFPAGTPINVFIPQDWDEVAYTVVAGTASGATYLVPTNGDTVMTYASSAPESGFAMKITGTSFVSVGGERVATVEAVVANQ